jgi:AAA15 family ATPase/GTPase
MILQFKVKNYRSYKEEVTFSMEAEASKQKSSNIFEFQLGNQQSVKYLKTSAIYGANASGKTNLIRSLYVLIRFIVNKPKIDERIELYEPFLFNNEYRNQPGYFELTFIGPRGYKYIYKLQITANTVLEEELNYYPNNRITNLFRRSIEHPEQRIHLGILGDSKDKKQIAVFSNQLLLSKFGDDEPDELLSDVFLHFKNYFVLNAVNHKHKDDLQLRVSQELFNNNRLQRKVALLIQAADTKISGIKLQRLEDHDLDHLNPETKAAVKRDPYIIYALHDSYNGETKSTDQISVNIQEESKGSQTLYALGGKILSTIENGGVLIVDELDTSLHPFITKLIVLLFQSEKINPKGAQLIFTTHDVSLLDRDLLRKDQIWFAEKSDMGVTDFYSLQDFEGLREDTPFEKWYLAGKFGALPNIKSLEKIFEDVSAD